MAVFTVLEKKDLEQILLHYAIGVLEDFEGIPSGIENTNYFVRVGTPQGSTKLVLTLFERLSASELQFYLALMRHLAQRGVPCPAPFLTRAGELFCFAKEGKPAALVRCLPGKDLARPGVTHCAMVGAALAHAHRAGADFGLQQPNLRGLAWWRQVVPVILPYLSTDRAILLQSELDAQEAFAQTAAYAALPVGPIHADLFRDNVLFDKDVQSGAVVLGGFIDFYFAGTDTWLFDLAVVMNDWTAEDLSPGSDADTAPVVPDSREPARFDLARAEALLNAYAGSHRFSDAERTAWPWMLRAAAYRFWVSRLYDWYLPRPAKMLTPKDPTYFERILRARIQRHDSGLQLP
ncbi:MAG: homoserine kinase [Burkholderiaceae bacterium]